MTLVRDVMIREFKSISPDDTLRDATETMKALDLEPLPICEGGKLIGMLTEEDVRRHAARSGLAAGSQPVRDAMTTEVVACREDQDTDACYALYHENESLQGCRGVLVVDADGQLAGIVAMRALQTGEPERPSVTGAVGASQSKVPFTEDPVDHMSEESFPASDPPPPPTNIGREDADISRS